MRLLKFLFVLIALAVHPISTSCRVAASVRYEGDLSVIVDNDKRTHAWRYFGLRCASGDMSAISDGNTTHVSVFRAGPNTWANFLDNISDTVPQFASKTFDGKMHRFLDPFMSYDNFKKQSSGSGSFINRSICDIKRPDSTTSHTQFSGPLITLSPPENNMRIFLDFSFKGDSMVQFISGVWVDDRYTAPKYRYSFDSHVAVDGLSLPTASDLVLNAGGGYGYDNTVTLRLRNIGYGGLPATHDFEKTVRTFTRELRQFNPATATGLGDYVTPRPPRSFAGYWLAAAALLSFLMFRRWRTGVAPVRA